MAHIELSWIVQALEGWSNGVVESWVSQLFADHSFAPILHHSSRSYLPRISLILMRCHTSLGMRCLGVNAARDGLAVASMPHFAVLPSSLVDGSRSEPRVLLTIAISRSGWQRVAMAQLICRSLKISTS